MLYGCTHMATVGVKGLTKSHRSQIWRINVAGTLECHLLQQGPEIHNVVYRIYV